MEPNDFWTHIGLVSRTFVFVTSPLHPSHAVLRPDGVATVGHGGRH
jgi:hypothetical protein